MKGPVRVLLVDDREIVRMTLRGILSDFDCVFEDADTGEAALAMLGTRSFDVVFLDVKLPDLSGIEVLREAKNRGIGLRNVIILTGLPERSAEREAIELGARKYLTKTSINRDQIRSAFQEVVPNAPARAPASQPVPPIEEVVPSRPRRPRNRDLPHLLVLDDNENWLEIMDSVLGDDFNLVLTTSPDEAVRHARRDAFDLVVLDMKLPGTSGFDVLSRMRKSRPSLRAIILTEHADLTAANESGRRGALDFVRKDRDTLATTIKDVLRRTAVNIRVFISYARADKDEVLDYYLRLTKRGFLPWMDEKNIVGGKKWEPQIMKAIEGADRFLFFLSRNSSNREGTMRAEINKALRIQDEKMRDSTFIIPARLEECEIEEDIEDFQTVDLFRPGGFEKLLEALLAE